MQSISFNYQISRTRLPELLPSCGQSQLTLKLHAQPGLRLHHDHQQQIPWTKPALPLGNPLPALNSTSVGQLKLNNGEVTLDGVIATGSESLTLDQTLVWNRPAWIEPDTPQHFEVLFEDPHLLAVNKPSGLPTLPGGGFMENTLLRAWCKSSKPPTQTQFTESWAEPPPVSSSSRRHRRRPLI